MKYLNVSEDHREYPIKNIEVCMQDRNGKNQIVHILDAEDLPGVNFQTILADLNTEDNSEDKVVFRIFVNHKDGRRYELKLVKEETEYEKEIDRFQKSSRY